MVAVGLITVSDSKEMTGSNKKRERADVFVKDLLQG